MALGRHRANNGRSSGSPFAPLISLHAPRCLTVAAAVDAGPPSRLAGGTAAEAPVQQQQRPAGVGAVR